MRMRLSSSKNTLSNLIRNKTLQAMGLINNKKEKENTTESEAKSEKLMPKILKQDEILKKLILFFNMREQFEFLKISKYFRKIIFNSNTYSKYLNIRSEFTGEITLIKQEEKKKEEIKKEKEKKEEEKKIKKKRVHSISNIIKSAKVPDLNSIYNVQDKNSDKKKIQIITFTELPKCKIDLKNLKYSDIIGANGDKILKFTKKFDLNPIEVKCIFFGLLESKMLLKETNNEFNIKNSGIGGAISLFVKPIINLKRYNLIKINVSGNQFNQRDLKYLGLIISLNSSTLSFLDLSYTNLDDENCRFLFLALKKCVNISLLNLTNNSIGSEGLSYLEKFFLNSEKLTTLMLRHNLIGTQGLIYLTGYFKLNKKIKLRTLDISYNGIYIEGVQTLTEFIVNYKKLISLYMGGNYIKEEGINILSNGLLNSQNCELSYLFLENNNLSTKKSIEYVANIISKHPFITSIELKTNELFDEYGSKLFELLNPESKLLSLDLSNNNIGEKTLDSMYNYLIQNKNLRRIILNENEFNEDCCKVIKDILKDSKVNIKNLSLKSCHIENNINLIFEGLTENKMIESIDLSNNKIGVKKKRFKSILNCLKLNKELNDINLDSNELHDDCLEILIEGLFDSTTIKNINLNENLFSKELYPKLLDLVKVNKYIKKLTIINSGFDEKSLIELDKIVKNNALMKNEKIIKNIIIYDDVMGENEEGSDDKDSSESFVRKRTSKKSNLKFN